MGEVTVDALDAWVVKARAGAVFVYANGVTLQHADPALIRAVQDLYDQGEVLLTRQASGPAGTPNRYFRYLAVRCAEPWPPRYPFSHRRTGEEDLLEDRARVLRLLRRHAHLRRRLPDNIVLATMLGLPEVRVRAIIAEHVAAGRIGFHVGEGRQRLPLIPAERAKRLAA